MTLSGVDLWMHDFISVAGNPLKGIAFFDYAQREYYVGHEWWVLNGLYCLILLLGSLFMMYRGRPFPLGKSTVPHNLFLCLWSLYMCVLSIKYVVNTYDTSGLVGVVCDPVTMYDPIESWYMSHIAMMFYVSKYYEFVDSFILVLRSGKSTKLSTLHVWHHISTSLLGSQMINSHFGFYGIMGCVLNCGIHVIMYFYYAAFTMWGYRPWWKRYLTSAQITQFFLLLCLNLVWVYIKYAGNHEQCPGSGMVSVTGVLVIISFISLFKAFYRRSYEGKSGSVDKKARKVNVTREKVFN
jgi:fatty acid elongase 3